jgi:hypothetical protein
MDDSEMLRAAGRLTAPPTSNATRRNHDGDIRRIQSRLSSHTKVRHAAQSQAFVLRLPVELLLSFFQ